MHEHVAFYGVGSGKEVLDLADGGSKFLAINWHSGITVGFIERRRLHADARHFTCDAGKAQKSEA